MAHHRSTTLRPAAFLVLAFAVSAVAQQSPGLPPSPLGQPPFGQRPGQSQITPDSSTPTLKVTTKLTIEDVTATDAKGKPVQGLKQSDFTVKEDGKQQKIKNFEEDGAAIPSQQSAPPPVLPPHVYTNVPPPGLQSGSVNILLLDTLNTGLARQAYVREKAISYLKSMPPDTEIAIFELGTGLRVVQGFTADRAILLAAINSFVPTMAVNPQGPRTPCEIGQLLNTRSRATLDALDAIAALGSGIKGRKSLIWFTPGLPQITAYEKLDYLLPCLTNFQPEMQRAYGLLTAAQVAVYPIDPRGLDAGGMAESVGELAFMESNAVRDLSFLSMQDMAAKTGGIAYYNRNDIDAAVGEAIASGADYYSLSYVPPPSKCDGKYHTIEVKVDHPDLHLQYREGYTDIDLAKPLAEKKDAKNAPAPESDFHMAVDQGVIPSTGLLFYLRVAPSTAQAKPGDPPVAEVLNSKLKGKPLVRYALTYEVPAGEVTLVDGPDGTRKGSLEFDIVAYGILAYGEDREKLNVVREVVNFTLKPNEVEHFVKNPFAVPVQIDLPPGKVDIHVGILDVASQRMGTLEITETVTKK